MSDPRRFVVLANTVGVLDFTDKERGWVRAEELIRVFPRKVSSIDLTTNSWIVEIMETTHESGDASPSEVYRLPIH